MVNITRVIDIIRAIGLVVVIITVSLVSPGPGVDTALGLAIAVTLCLSAAAWIVWMLAEHRPWLNLGSLVVMGVAGGVLAGLSPSSPAVAIGCAAAFSAGVRLKTEVSLGVMAATVAAFLVTALATGAPTGALLGFPFAFAGLWSVSLTRREYLVRAQQAEHMLAETRRAREAETQAAALAERARIARDIHDVLAHSLAAVSVNLQAAEGLLAADTLPADNPELAKAVECINRASHPQTQVVVLTTYSDDESIIGALQAGALGYLTKDATRAEIGRAVLAAAAGQAVLDPEVQQRLLSAAVRAPAAPSAAGAADPADTDLTPRESEVLRLIAAGKSNREIARALFVSEATVKTHVNRIFAKTGSRDRTQAMRYAYTHGYADPY